MRKLQVWMVDAWQYVFCYSEMDGIVTTKDRKFALPQKAIWAEDDLRYFSNRYGNHCFRLDNM